MRRETRPFVVEVRRGQKKSQPVPVPAPMSEPASDDDVMRRAEAALFGRAEPSGDAQDPSGQPFSPPRRILEAIVPEPATAETAAFIEPEPEPKRRGRKPGSKNRPKEAVEADSAPKRRRGRPRKNAEGAVRSVEVTPELANAALEIMAKSTPLPTATPVPVAVAVAVERPMAPAAAAPMAPLPVGKRPRGRPRKQPLMIAPEPVAQVDASYALPSSQISTSRILARYGADSGPRAGQLWMRRLRGFTNPDHVSIRRRKP